MKKTLAIVLSLLVAFSMFTVMASATDVDTTGLVTVEFVYVTEDKPEVIDRVRVAPGTVIASEDYVPAIPTEFKKQGKDEKGNDATYKYTFKGWKSLEDGAVYYPSQLPTVSKDTAAGTLIVYTADYMIEDVTETQSFWDFVASLFARINILFEYFATIFKF